MYQWGATAVGKEADPSKTLYGQYLRIVPLNQGYLLTKFHDSIAVGHSWGINFPALSTYPSSVTTEMNKGERLRKPLTWSGILCGDC